MASPRCLYGEKKLLYTRWLQGKLLSNKSFKYLYDFLLGGGPLYWWTHASGCRCTATWWPGEQFSSHVLRVFQSHLMKIIFHSSGEDLNMNSPGPAQSRSIEWRVQESKSDRVWDLDILWPSPAPTRLLSLFEHQQGPGITDVSLYSPLIGRCRPLIGLTLTLDTHITDSDQLGLESIGAEHNISFSHNISIFPCRNCQEIALNLTKQRYISIRTEYHLTL